MKVVFIQVHLKIVLIKLAVISFKPLLFSFIVENIVIYNNHPAPHEQDLTQGQTLSEIQQVWIESLLSPRPVALLFTHG